jgi:hypothetical protein
MSEINPSTISALDLYAMHTDYANAYETVKTSAIRDDELVTIPPVRKVVDSIEDVASAIGLGIENQEITEELLQLKANTAQKGILEPKIALRRIRLTGALGRLNIVDALATDAFNIQGDRWHEEALEEMAIAMGNEK